ncbi:TM2 domain-containing membrane protein YozV [Mycobacterium frederiksbergense]|uniref:TM2 domain-containing membrane protein YozV n=1 Tax=Mycolicibacterium frederiksbergense TaxID=117567 RepID=A0ABT6LB85_9MYCO|nr:DUF2510 domain-containing protein [Mycolicibacterium frederiksbergense]MDH6199250.1 TM2 domain-containing membrane protein YozV [Mycolicibacterium frederiksbergense]
MTVTITCPKCKAKLSTKGEATSFRCVKCGEVSPMPISKLAKTKAATPAKVASPPSPKPLPGWYPDPNGAPTQRYFDGTAWTDQLAPLSTPAPRPAKSGVVAGLLQLFLGWFGLGRFYLGYTGIGGVQLTLGLIGLIGTLMCWVGLIVLVPLSIWLFIEGICMIAGAIPDVTGQKVN